MESYEGKYLISYVKQEIGRDIATEASKKFRTTNTTTYAEIKKFCEVNALILQIGYSSATRTPKLQVVDDKNRCHLEALQLN